MLKNALTANIKLKTAISYILNYILRISMSKIKDMHHFGTFHRDY